MPLEVVYKSKLETAFYGSIGQTGYGRIQETSPYHGLAAFGASYCTVIIGHCFELKRTILINTPNYMFVKDTLEPIFDWLVAKNEDKYNKCNSIEVVVIPGYLYREPKHAAKFHHDDFMLEVRQFFKDTYTEHTQNIDEREPLLSSSLGSVVVDKKTGLITILELPPELPIAGYSQVELSREIFANDLFPFLNITTGKHIKNRHLQFDNDRYTVHSKISDNCRLVLRAQYCLNWSEEETNLLKLLDVSIPKPLLHEIKESLRLPGGKLPCELCSNEGQLICSDCKGAWYCGRDHQRADWKEHKRFCELYTLKK